MDDSINIFDDWDREAELRVRGAKPIYTKTVFPEWPNGVKTFDPYTSYNLVPFDERFKGEWLLFSSNQAVFEGENGEEASCTVEFFYKYRINSLEKQRYTNQYWSGYIEYLEKELEKNEKGQSKPLYLESFFYDTYKAIKIKELLVNKGWCNEGTFVWINCESGNKGLLVAVIKDLFAKKYLKSKPTWKEIKEVSLNSFSLEIGEHTAKTGKANPNELNFIPFASALK